MLQCGAVTLGLESLLEDEVAVGMESNSDILVAGACSDREAASVVSEELAERFCNHKDLVGRRCNRRRHHVIIIRTVPGSIGVGEAIQGVAVAGFDSIKPSLLDREAQAGMIEPDQGINAGEIKASWVKWGTCSMGGQGNSLGCTIQVVDQAGNPRRVRGKDALVGMRVHCRRHGWRNDHWGWWGQSHDTGWWRRKWRRS
jgi:hypothetical protein